MKRALVTGATGQDGSYMCELLLDMGYEVTAMLRRSSSPNLKRLDGVIDRVKSRYGDLTDQASLVNILKDADPDEIYALGAQSFVGTSWSQPIYTCEVTGLGQVKLLEAVRQTNPLAKVYFAASSEMYGNTPPKQTEESIFAPRSPYGYAKLLAYWATRNHRDSYGMFCCNGICFNHESPRRGTEFVTKKIAVGVANCVYDSSYKIKLGNLDAMRDWGYAPEYCEAMYLMMQHSKPDDYVIATGEVHTVREFLEEAFRVVGIGDWEKHVEIDPSCKRPVDDLLLCGDSTKAKKVLGWQPATRFKRLVKIMVENELDETWN